MRYYFNSLIILSFFIWSCEELANDTTPPTVSITTAFSGSVYEIVTIAVMVNDDTEIDKVELWVDGVNTNITDDSEPYQLLWNTTTYENGTAHVLVARAYDTSGNEGDSQSLTLTVDNSLAVPTTVDISVNYENESFKVTWTKNDDEDFLSYTLYESDTDDHTGGSVIYEAENKSDTTFTVTGITQGMTKYYWVTTTDSIGLSSQSDIQKGKAFSDLSFSINMEESLPSTAVGMVFISNLDGSLVTDTLFYGNTSFSWDWTQGLDETPDKVSISFVYPDYFFDGIEYIINSIRIETYFDVDPDTWSIETISPYEYYDVNLNFENISDHDGFLISGGYSRSFYGSGSIYSDMSMNLRKSPDDLFIVLNTNDSGPIFRWYNDVSDGNTYSVDLSTLSSMDSTTISFPVVEGFEPYASIYGYLPDYVHWNDRYRVGTSSITTLDVSTATLMVPFTQDFTQFKSFLYSNTEDARYGNMVFGEIPTEFQMIDADFEYISFEYNNFSITTSGSFDIIRSYWQGESSVSTDWGVSWSVNCPPEITEYHLPEMPSSVQEIYGMNNSVFTNSITYLRQYPDVNGYEGFIEAQKSAILFDDIVKNRYDIRKYPPEGTRLLKLDAPKFNRIISDDER